MQPHVKQHTIITTRAARSGLQVRRTLAIALPTIDVVINVICLLQGANLAQADRQIKSGQTWKKWHLGWRCARRERVSGLTLHAVLAQLLDQGRTTHTKTLGGMRHDAAGIGEGLLDITHLERAEMFFQVHAITRQSRIEIV